MKGNLHTAVMEQRIIHLLCVWFSVPLVLLSPQQLLHRTLNRMHKL